MARRERTGLHQSVTLADRTYHLALRSGLEIVTDTAPAAALVAENTVLRDGERVLVAPCGDGLLGMWATDRAGSAGVSCFDTNALAVETTQRNLQAAGLADVPVRTAVPEVEAVPYDTFVMPLPKGRDLARLWLLNGALATRMGGQIVIAGANRAGIQSVARDAEALLGPGRLLGYRKGNRALSFQRQELAVEELDAFRAPGLRNGTFARYTFCHGGHALTVCTRPGVFSRDALDEGTQMLLQELDVHPDDRVLDVGCGAGVIGLVAALYADPASVTLSDIDSLATECARETLRQNGINGPSVLLGDGLSAVEGQRFTLIVTNPPFHQGHTVNTGMTEGWIRQAYRALLPGGRLVLVANRFLPYASWLQTGFDRVSILAEDSRFQVFSAQRTQR
ncbi:MAG: methyltransferase [Anaerolineae bacterium]|nr:methyltransferase [Chloroflexota bacterium]